MRIRGEYGVNTLIAIQVIVRLEPAMSCLDEDRDLQWILQSAVKGSACVGELGMVALSLGTFGH